MEMAKIVHNNYEKITDDIMLLSPKWILRFNVLLNKYYKNKKYNYHKEIEYVKNNSRCINITRSFNYYLSIESTKSTTGEFKESVIIRLQDMYAVKYKLKLISEWFTADKNQGLFAKKDGRIIIVNKVNPIIINDLALDKYLEFEPAIYNDQNTEDQFIGVNVYIGSNNNVLFLTVSRLFAFMDFINTFNMYQSAQLLLNYVQRPEYGSNMYSMINDTYCEEPGYVVMKTNMNDKSLSFFEKTKCKKVD